METSGQSQEQSTVLYNPFDKMSFTYDKCFLCGQPLEERTTIEHVFPRWLLNRFNLWDQKLILLNGTEISYRQLTIPCCSSCNNEHLSNLEQTIQHGVEGGYSEFSKIDDLLIYQWMSKIFYGLLFKELSLLVDRKSPDAGMITSPDLLERYRTEHGFLQSTRTPFEFVNLFPGSVFVLWTHAYGDERDFNYHDGLFTLTLSIRMGEIGIITVLQDNGVQKELLAEYYEKLRGITLHPVQFDELSAQIAYRATLMNRVPKYITHMPESEAGVVTVVSLPLQGLSTKPIFDDWNQRGYARILAEYWQQGGLTFGDIFQEPDSVLSSLQNEHEQIRVLDSEGNVIGLID